MVQQYAGEAVQATTPAYLALPIDVVLARKVTIREPIVHLREAQWGTHFAALAAEKEIVVKGLQPHLIQGMPNLAFLDASRGQACQGRYHLPIARVDVCPSRNRAAVGASRGRKSRERDRNRVSEQKR
jgi:hypothetical protein